MRLLHDGEKIVGARACSLSCRVVWPVCPGRRFSSQEERAKQTLWVKKWGFTGDDSDRHGRDGAQGGILESPQVSCFSVCSFCTSSRTLHSGLCAALQIRDDYTGGTSQNRRLPVSKPQLFRPQSRWNTFCRSTLTGLLSGLVSMMSAMKSHHLRLMAVSAPLAQSSSSSISM